MKLKFLLVIGTVLISFLITGYQCSSAEMTSAKLYIQQKNYVKAVEVLLKEVEKNPKSDEGYYLLGLVYGELDKMEEMMDAYKKSLEVSDRFKKDIFNFKKYHWANYFNKGVSFFNKANSVTSVDSSKLFYDKSVQAFLKTILIEPDSADAYKNLAFVYLNQQKEDEAIKPLMILINLQKAVDGYKFLGRIYYNKGDNLRVKYSEAHNVSDSLEAQKYFNLAINTLEEGRKIHPDESEILLHLSNAYIAANKIEIALDAFKAGIEQEPENQYYRYNYGVLLLGKNDFEGATEQFKKAIEIDDNYQNAIYNIAVTYVKWGAKLSKETEGSGQENPKAKEKYKSALPYLESYIQNKQDDPMIWDLLGKVYSVLGQLNDAQNAFSKADQYRKK